MAPTNHDRVGKALGLLNTGMLPFIERELRAVYGDRWLEEANVALGEERVTPKKRKGIAQNWHTQAILTLVYNLWHDVYRNTLGFTERAIVEVIK